MQSDVVDKLSTGNSSSNKISSIMNHMASLASSPNMHHSEVDEFIDEVSCGSLLLLVGDLAADCSLQSMLVHVLGIALMDVQVQTGFSWWATMMYFCMCEDHHGNVERIVPYVALRVRVTGTECTVVRRAAWWGCEVAWAWSCQDSGSPDATDENRAQDEKRGLSSARGVYRDAQQRNMIGNFLA